MPCRFRIWKGQAMKDIEHNPYKITKEMVACSMGKLEKMK